MSAKKRPKKSISRYARPDLKPETLEDLKMLSFLIGEGPHPPGTEDVWLWDEAKMSTGKPMHRLLIAAVGAAIQEDYFLELEAKTIESKGGVPLQKEFANARSGIFKTICERALKRGDAAFFRHLADCISLRSGIPRKKGQGDFAPFKSAVLRVYEYARFRVAQRSVPNPVPPNFDFGERMKNARPLWIDVREQMEVFGVLPPDFLDKDVENQRKQIEDTLKALRLPFAQKRQAG